MLKDEILMGLYPLQLIASSRAVCYSFVVDKICQITATVRCTNTGQVMVISMALFAYIAPP